MDDLAQLPIEFVSADTDQTRLAARLKAEDKLTYADCFAASLAILRHATLFSADSDFVRFKKKLSLFLL